MRQSTGDRLRLFNGRDGEWSARIVTMGKRGALLEAEALLRPQTPEPDLWLLLSIIKREPLEWAVEKATELGVAEIHPMITARSQPARPNPDRLRAIATEAAEQCERLTVPLIHAPRPLDAALRDWPSGRRSHRRHRTRRGRAAQAGDRPAAALVIGPEGGLRPQGA